MSDAGLRSAWQRHERRWGGNLYVYPVVARRSRGLSIGVNLSPDKTCNFGCVYCQVDRTSEPLVRAVDPVRLRRELEAVIQAARDGSLFEQQPLRELPAEMRAIRDIAFSGDGEPTLSPAFHEAVSVAAAVRREFQLDAVKLVLLTNATRLDVPAVRESLRVLDRNNGEIWAKLDAGGEEQFRRVNRSAVPFRRVLDNILDAARERPLVIQSLWFASGGRPAPPLEVEAYCSTLNQLIADGARFSRIQVYTVARVPAEPCVSGLDDDQLDAVAEHVRARVDVPVEVYYGTTPDPVRVRAPRSAECIPPAGA